MLDLFAGSGALGIEALSRGAAAGGVRGARRHGGEACWARIWRRSGIDAEQGELRRVEAARRLRSARAARRDIRSRVHRPSLRPGARAGHRSSRRQLPPLLAAGRACRRRERPARAAAARAAGRAANDATATLRSQSTATHDPHLTTSIAVCPGTYDPITNGHLDVIRRAARPLRRGRRRGRQPLGAQEPARCSGSRSASASSSARSADLESVRVEPFSTLVVDFARQRRRAARSSRACARSRTSSTSWR